MNGSIPQTMRAAIHTRYGPPEVVRVMEVPVPEPGKKEVLIRIMASTVNRTDSGFRSAEYFISRFWSGLFRPKYRTLGCEYAGIVEAVGAEVTLFKPGDRVFGYDDKTFGGHAEFRIANENDALCLIPDSLDYHTAAPLTEGAHYALCNIRASGIRAGQKAMVYGATGAIGSAAVQLLKHFNVDVTAVCSTPHIELVKGLGADQVVDYTKQDFTKTETRYDLVFDAVGKSTFGACKPILTPKGIYISTELGPGGQNPFLALITPLFGGKKLMFPLPVISREDVEYLGKLAASGQFKPLTDRKFTLDQIVEAYRYVQTGQKIGNVLLLPFQTEPA